MQKEIVSVDEFRTLLANTKGEREIALYLKKHPWVPYWTICPASGHDRYAIFEFPLGTSHKADLLILNSYSGVWEAIFVEFEPVDDPVFTKNGVPSKSLAIAQRQVDDWREYINNNKDFVRKELVRYAKKFDKLGYSSRGSNPSNYSGNRLADPNSFLKFNFKIIIGRSTLLNAATRQLIGRVQGQYDLEVFTYDRLLHLAEMRYENKHGESPWSYNLTV